MELSFRNMLKASGEGTTNLIDYTEVYMVLSFAVGAATKFSAFACLDGAWTLLDSPGLLPTEEEAQQVCQRHSDRAEATAAARAANAAYKEARAAAEAAEEALDAALDALRAAGGSVEDLI